MTALNVRRWFWILSRASFVIFFTPKQQNELFIPFMSSSYLQPWDPWGKWLEINPNLEVFPYGPVMFIFLLPASFLSHLISVAGLLSFGDTIEITILLTILFLDYILCRIVGAFKHNNHVWGLFYILSPFLLYVCYVQGQLDIIPACLFLVSTQFVTRSEWFKSGLFLGLAISAKFSLILALPFFVLFFIFDLRRIKSLKYFAFGLIPTGVISLLPYAWSDGYRKMVIGSPEIVKSLEFSISIGDIRILLLPVAYFLLFLWFWNLNRVSVTLLASFQGVTLLNVATLQNSSIGWFLWGLAIIATTLQQTSRRTLLLFYLWQCGVVAYYIMREPTFHFRFEVIEIGPVDLTALALLFTINFVIGLTLSVKLLNDSIKLDDFYGIGHKPLSIAVAGDSGVGKDTLVSSISRAFGDSEVAVLHGDDYHLHERGDLAWRTTTHLDPEANDLGAWSRDFRKAIKREKVFSRHYDHSVGRFSPPRETPARDLVILNGLHSHLIPDSEKIDLKVFLSMEESLRIVLKVKRDTIERGSGDSNQVIKLINDRKDHFNSFVLPQKLSAHLILHLFPVTGEPLRLGVSIRTPNQSVIREIYRIVNSLGRVASRLDRSESGELWLTVEAYEISKDENLDILLSTVAHPDKLLIRSDNIDSGVNGFISAVCLIALANQRVD